MTARFNSEILAAREEIVAPPLPRACEDRTFELPPVLHIATAALFLAFVSILSFAFMGPTLVVPYAIFAIFIVAFFTVPAIWARMEPKGSRTKALSWAEFREGGIALEHGRCSGPEAAVLVLTLPVLIVCWAIAVVTIAALI